MNPMSEEPYVWNGNDPISNYDPSGYEDCPQDPATGALMTIGCTTAHAPPNFIWYGPRFGWVPILGPGGSSGFQVYTLTSPPVLGPLRIIVSRDRFHQCYAGTGVSPGTLPSFTATQVFMSNGQLATTRGQIASVVTRWSVGGTLGLTELPMGPALDGSGNFTGTQAGIGIGPAGPSPSASFMFGPVNC
jgi:hypothetical protein